MEQSSATAQAPIAGEPAPTGFKAFVRRAEIALFLIGLLSPIVAMVGWVVSRAHYDLVVWVDTTKPIYPTPETGDRALSLAFEGADARSVALSRVRVRNEGKQSIGNQSDLWWLDLRVAEPGRISLRKETRPDVSPNRTRFLTPVQEAPNRVRLRMGLLEPGAEVNLEFVLVNLARGVNTRPDIQADSGLPGIPTPLVTHQSVSARFTEAAALPSCIVVALAVVGRIAWLVLRRNQRLGAAILSEFGMRPGWWLLLNVPALIFLLALAVALLASIAGLLAYAVWVLAS